MSSPHSSLPITQPPLIVITGPTASGKSDLALDLAERYSGEIICADSRTVYRGMDIGTAKPSQAEQLRVPHHLLDVAEPDEKFTAAEFKRLADLAIADIRRRGKLPFLVGGTGLYIDGVILDYQFGERADQAKRRQLETLSTKELQTKLHKDNIDLPNNPLNKRQLIRAIEQGGVNQRRRAMPDEKTIVVAIASRENELDERIVKRADKMFEAGVLDEAQKLAGRYGWRSPGMEGNIYPIIRRLLEGGLTTEQAKQEFIKADKKLAKRQLTWLRRHKFVHWLSLREADSFLSGYIEHRKNS